jgi:hypothetical protein
MHQQKQLLSNSRSDTDTTTRRQTKAIQLTTFSERERERERQRDRQTNVFHLKALSDISVVSSMVDERNVIILFWWKDPDTEKSKNLDINHFV